MIIYVDCKARPNGDGTKDKPFMHIQEAADIARPGDEVIVASGVYHEEVSPVNAGTARDRIVYRSAEKGGAVITGAEKFDNWEHYEGDVYKLTVGNAYFGKCNPYKIRISGDWLNMGIVAHTGEVFLNNKSLYEKESLEEVINPEIYKASWDRDFTKYTWYTEQTDNDETVIYANFQGKNPNEEEVEITVRPHCFYPAAEHVDYITLDGFNVTKAATQWAPPTALQEGMIGPHWSKGWIIENCEVSHSKCSGISLGKYFQQNNNNKWSEYKYKDGSQTQRDCALIAQLDGWSKETIGSHIIRNCDIHDCGQTGIVGSLGCVFSVIENNHIHHINNKRNLAGAEIGGIKLHAAIDVIIKNNHFHDCTRGIWLDWQHQGTRVTQNLFHDNTMARDYILEKENIPGLGLGEDIWVEVGHGPTIIDNNYLLSDRSARISSQGVAFVHNFIAGSFAAVGRGVKNGTVTYDSARYTPIHVPHRTEITGFMSILHGDMRFYNNIFMQQKTREKLVEICDGAGDSWDDCNLICGTKPYDGFMTESQWKSHFEGYCGEGADRTRDMYYMPLPVWTGGNVYFNGAKPCDIEDDFTVDTEHEITFELKEENGEYVFTTNAGEYLPEAKLISSDTLGIAFEPEERFENPDGSDIIFDTDFYGNKRSGRITAGPV